MTCKHIIQAINGEKSPRLLLLIFAIAITDQPTGVVECSSTAPVKHFLAGGNNSQEYWLQEYWQPQYQRLTQEEPFLESGDKGQSCKLGELSGMELLHSATYFTMYQHNDHVTLRVTTNNKIEWHRGTPTLYSAFREHSVLNKGSGERTFLLEAIATGNWLCMNDKGKLYTTQLVSTAGLGKGKDHDLEHTYTDGSRVNRKMSKSKRRQPFATQLRPPADCIFKAYEYDNYERSVAMYSYAHSNSTHGRFLGRATTGEPRSFRKSFRSVSKSQHLKISQVPIQYMKEMVNKTRFGSIGEQSVKIRRCITRSLLICVKWEDSSAQRSLGYYVHNLISKCKKRVTRRIRRHQQQTQRT